MPDKVEHAHESLLERGRTLLLQNGHGSFRMRGLTGRRGMAGSPEIEFEDLRQTIKLI